MPDTDHPNHDHAPSAPVVPVVPVVLVVDDDDAVRGLIRRSLERAGLTVTEARSGREALSLLHEGMAVSSVVTDLKMAEGSGGWLLAQLAYEFPQLLPRVLVVSGNADSAAAAHVAARWRCPVLAKPFTMADLVAAVRRAAG